MLLDVRIVGKEEGPIAENVVKVVDAGYVVAVEQVQILEESAILGHRHSRYVGSCLLPVAFVAFQYLIHLHEPVAFMNSCSAQSAFRCM